MKNMLKNKNTRTDLLTYLLVIVAFVVMQGMNSATCWAVPLRVS